MFFKMMPFIFRAVIKGLYTCYSRLASVLVAYLLRQRFVVGHRRGTLSSVWKIYLEPYRITWVIRLFLDIGGQNG